MTHDPVSYIVLLTVCFCCLLHSIAACTYLTFLIVLFDNGVRVRLPFLCFSQTMAPLILTSYEISHCLGFFVFVFHYLCLLFRFHNCQFVIGVSFSPHWLPELSVDPSIVLGIPLSGHIERPNRVGEDLFTLVPRSSSTALRFPIHCYSCKPIRW